MALTPRLVRGWPLRTKLIMGTMAVTASTMILVAIAVVALLGRVSAVDRHRVLQSRLDAVAATIRPVGDTVRVLETPNDSVDQGSWVFDTTGRLREGVMPPFRKELLAMARTRQTRTVLVGDRFRLMARPVYARHHRLIAVVAASLDVTPYQDAKSRALWLVAGLGVLTVLGSGLAAGVASRVSLAQVREMARRADAWQEHNATARFRLGSPRDELTELGQTLDHLLDRISAALQAERRLTAEVAHELRTPLAVIRTEAQLGLAANAREHDTTLERIVSQTARMDSAIQTMLAAARASNLDGEDCDLADLLSSWSPEPARHAQRTLTTQVPSHPVWVAAPRELVQAALSPLVDNAIRHARRQVTVSTRAETDRVVVSVLDDGPGVAPGDVDLIFRPGRSATGHDGAGLGLPLSRRLARSVGGDTLAVAGSTGHFQLRLPRLPHAAPPGA